MKLSKNIQDTIELFKNNVNIKTTKIVKMQGQKDEVIKKLYNDINSSYTYIKLLIKKGVLSTNIIEKNKTKLIPKTSLLNSKFVPENVKEAIKLGKGYFECNIKLYNTNITLYILLTDKDFRNLNKYDKYIIDTITWLKIALLYSKIKTSELKIYLYLTDIKKKIPKNQTSILCQDNCNTAVTTACTPNGEILIYRKEEWFKVLIHETFHTLCLDFSGLLYRTLRSKVKSIFNIKSHYEITETYCEVWATIINSLFYSYNLLNDKNDIEQFIKYYEICISFEKKFSVFQCIKILDFMNLRYQDLYTTNEKRKQLKIISYREDTNVFAYYIIKMILLVHSDEFMIWCNENNLLLLSFNKTDRNLNKFFDLINSKYKSIKVLNYINTITKFYKKIQSENKVFLNETMRMTLFS